MNLKVLKKKLGEIGFTEYYFFIYKKVTFVYEKYNLVSLEVKVV